MLRGRGSSVSLVIVQIVSPWPLDYVGILSYLNNNNYINEILIGGVKRKERMKKSSF